MVYGVSLCGGHVCRYVSLPAEHPSGCGPTEAASVLTVERLGTWYAQSRSQSGRISSILHSDSLCASLCGADWYKGQTTVGLGFIELGHSGVDTTGSEFVPELLRLYERTHDPAVLNQALIQLVWHSS